jgi:response regulator RpfG family c-di-GMP phosphodiesterase
MGFDEYLTKPATREDLVDAVDEMCQRNEYQDRLQEMFALASKKATLETEKSRGELDDSEEYERLCEEFDRIQQDVMDAVDEAGAEWPALMHDATAQTTGGSGSRI